MKIIILIISLFMTSPDLGFSPIKTAKNLDETFFTVKESETEFSISTGYNVDKHNKVESLLNDYLKKGDDPSFKNTKLDAHMTLSDKTNFYIKFYPGRLFFKLDKQKNSRKTLIRFKEMGRELKRFL